MPRVPRSVVAERKKRAWELACQGWSETRIGLELGVDQSTVSRYLTAIARKIDARLEEEALRTKILQIEQLRFAIDEAFQAWQASKKPEQIVSKKTVPGEVIDETGQRSAPQEIVTTRVRGQTGDPRFLREAREAMADIRDILGMKPEREEYPVLKIDEVQRLFEQLTPGAQTAYLRLVELVINRGRVEGVSEEEPKRITSRSGQTYFT